MLKMRKIASNFVGPYHGNQIWPRNGSCPRWSSPHFFFLYWTLVFYNPVIYLFFLMCYGYTKISFKIVWRILRVDVWFGIFKHKYCKCYIQTRRMDTLPSTSQTRDILITLPGLSSELIYFFSLRNLKKKIGVSFLKLFLLSKLFWFFLVSPGSVQGKANMLRILNKKG